MGTCGSYIEAFCHKPNSSKINTIQIICRPKIRKQKEREREKPPSTAGSPHHSSDACKHGAHNPFVSGTSFRMSNLDDKEPILDPIALSFSDFINK